MDSEDEDEDEELEPNPKLEPGNNYLSSDRRTLAHYFRQAGAGRKCNPFRVPFFLQETICLDVLETSPWSSPPPPSVTSTRITATGRPSSSYPRAGRSSGSLPRRPCSYCLRFILCEGSQSTCSPIRSSHLLSFVPFSSIVMS